MTTTQAKPHMKRSPNNVIPDADLLALLARGRSNTDIAAIYGCSDRTVMRMKRRLGIASANPLCTYRFTDADRELLAFMVADGWPMAEIRATTGWDFNTIHRHAPGPVAWDHAAVSDFRTALRSIRSRAVRPEWLPPNLGGRKQRPMDVVRTVSA